MSIDVEPINPGQIAAHIQRVSQYSRPSVRRTAWTRLLRPDGLTLMALAVWTAFPIALQIANALRHGGSFDGGVSIQPDDLFQYLWWVRDSGAHVLISDPFQLVASSQAVFLQPMFLLSGLLWRAGLSLPLAYLIPWAPASVLLTFFGFRAYVRRHLRGGLGTTAALFLAFFYFAPASWLAQHTGHSWGHIWALSFDGTTALALWGYFPRAIAIALVPLLLLRMERIASSRVDDPAQARLRPNFIVGTLGLIVGWLHPWQGAEVVLIAIGFVAWTRPRRRVAVELLIPAIGAGAALSYYLLLGHFDYFWHMADSQSSTVLAWQLSPMAPVLFFLPLVGASLLGLRRRLPKCNHRRLLFLWLAASAICYFAITTDRTHALDGVTLPLSILAVQGWQRLNLRGVRHVGPLGKRVLAILCALLVIAPCTLLGMVDWGNTLRRTETTGQTFPREDLRALHYLAEDPARGGVLAPVFIAYAVPSYTGRSTFTGDFPWSPHYGSAHEADFELYYGRLSPEQARSLVSRTGARFLLVDCLGHTALPAKVAPLIIGRHRFGCAAVYDLR